MAKTATKSRTTAKKTTKAAARKTTAKAKPKTAAKTKAKAKTTTKSKAAATKTKAKTKPATDDGLNLLDETGLRKSSDRRVEDAIPAAERRKTPRRRRQIDPTTCEREYSEQEIQFMHAMDEYKQLSGRMFPTCSEILEVLANLGYRQVAQATAVYDPNTDSKTAASEEEDDDDDVNEVESCI